MKNPGRVDYAKTHSRDAEGHFIKENPQDPSNHQHTIINLLKESIHYSKTQNDLIDLRIGNPLERLMEYLQEIKKQKAFSFTIKGSLGILGVALALSVFGIFGGSKMLCDKGMQSEIGMIKVLKTTEPEASGVFLLGPFIDLYNARFNLSVSHPRVLLIKNNADTIGIPYNSSLNLGIFINQPVIATGQYDACSAVLKVNNQAFLEPVQ